MQAHFSTNHSARCIWVNLFSCNVNCSVDSLAHWSQWSACSFSCGSGVQQRHFNCKKKKCDRVQTRSCQITSCSIHDMTGNNLGGLLRRGRNDLALINHDIKELFVSSEIECALYCLRLPECSSINVKVQKDLANPAKENLSLLCQLNNATADSEPENLVGINGSTYYSFISRQSRT